MAETTLLLVVATTFVALIALRTPIAFALGLAALTHSLLAGIPLLGVIQKICSQLADTTLLAIPFFVLCGEIMRSGGMAERLIDLATVLVGRWRGGLAMVNIVASMFFGGISGSSVADTSSIGSVLIPSMVKKGYRRGFAVAVTVSSSTQGLIIPPSHNAIIFALAAGGAVSIKTLFLAGYLPGLLVCLTLMALSAVLAHRYDFPREVRLGPSRGWQIFGQALPALATPFIIIVPITLGQIPAHQAAVIAVVWAAGVSTFWYRSLPLKSYWDLLRRTSRTSGIVMILIGTAAAFGEALTYLHVPQQLSTLIAGLDASPITALLAINAMLLVLGAVMDMAPLIVIITPILLPTVTALGIAPVQFGVILLLNLGIGLCTPPVGSTLFVGCAIGEISVGRAARALIPFYLVMILVVLAVTFIPELSLALPQWLAGSSQFDQPR